MIKACESTSSLTFSQKNIFFFVVPETIFVFQIKLMSKKILKSLCLTKSK